MRRECSDKPRKHSKSNGPWADGVAHRNKRSASIHPSIHPCPPPLPLFSYIPALPPPFLSSHTSLPSPPLPLFSYIPALPPPLSLFSYIPALPPPFLSSHTSLPSPPLPLFSYIPALPPPSSLLIHPCPPPPFLSSHTSLPSPPLSSLLIHPSPPPPSSLLIEHAGRALPAAPGHRLAGRVLPLRERAHVLKLALDKTQQFLRAGELLGGQLHPLCNALVPFGGYKCMGRTERPVFACRPAMQEHMRRLEVHCRALWARRLARPGRGRQEAFLSNYLPRPLGGQASLRPFQRVRPQRPHCPPAQPPPPARPAGAPRALGRGLGTVRVLCPAHGAATCAACAATGQGIKYCCSLGHKGHRLAPAAQRAGARALRAWLQAPQQVPRPAPPPGTVLGSRGRESPRGSSEDEPPQARRRVLPPAVLGRRRRPPRVGSSSDDDEPPRRRPPLRAGPSLSHSSRDSSPHHPRGYAGGGGGRRGGGSASATVPATGEQPQWLRPHISWGAVVACTPAGCVVGHDFTALPLSYYGHVPRRGRGAGTGAREPRGRFWLHLGRAT